MVQTEALRQVSKPLSLGEASHEEENGKRRGSHHPYTPPFPFVALGRKAGSNTRQLSKLLSIWHPEPSAGTRAEQSQRAL